jgi:hypothetical protein
MANYPPESNAGSPSRVKNITYAVLAAQGGCFTLVIIFVALFIGLWLDAQAGQRGPFTIGLLLLSIPLSLFVMVRLALRSIARIAPPTAPKSTTPNKQEVGR